MRPSVAPVVSLLALLGCTAERICGEASGETRDAPDGCVALPQTTDNAPSGLARCGTDDIVRFAALACSGCVDVVLCTSDVAACAACADGEVCAEGSLGSCFCHAPCTADADCGPGAACVCPAGGAAQSPSTNALYPQCVPAACTTNDDCPSGRCKLSAGPCGAPDRLACASAADTCGTSADCEAGAGTCRFDVAADHFLCAPDADCG